MVVVLDALAYSRSGINSCNNTTVMMLTQDVHHPVFELLGCMGLFGGPGLSVGIGYRDGEYG